MELIIFLKGPRVGFVKTRLAQSIGPAAACAAYRRLVETVLGQLTNLPNVELRFTPDDAGNEIAPWLRPGWESRPQGSGDLGERLAAAFAEHFARGARRVVIIGSDCPFLGEFDIRAGWDALQTHDLVLGPARDGGYWLIGLRGPQSSLFHGVTWSTNSVLDQTLDRAVTANLKFHLLRELSDVDTFDEWQMLANKA